MTGYQITFYTLQDRTIGHQPLAEWLLQQAAALGLKGATINGAIEGIGHDGRMHAITMFDLAEQPLQITMVVSTADKQRLLDHLQHQPVNVFYTVQAVEYGVTGTAYSGSEDKE
ncbi:DUF190 domain-containing protein [Oceanobacter mangrovi]|uniref:DUF190 domain-containing protein n=1 Tax=Oceanobacter mangrovi TaxID=2862510 RepID=UPI001C8D1400|nr:DUF190 domain-containing protein [Oceanobacter mangrovi]